MTQAIFISRCPNCHQRISHDKLENWLNCPSCGSVQRLNAVTERVVYEGELASIACLPLGD